MSVNAHRELQIMDQQVKRLCRALPNDATRRVLTSSRELATNVINHAGGGTLSWYEMSNDDRHGFAIVAVDDGPGIADVERALEDGYSTIGGLGLGLGGVKRMMGELFIESAPAGGAKVTAILWR